MSSKRLNLDVWTMKNRFRNGLIDVLEQTCLLSKFWNIRSDAISVVETLSGSPTLYIGVSILSYDT